MRVQWKNGHRGKVELYYISRKLGIYELGLG